MRTCFSTVHFISECFSLLPPPAPAAFSVSFATQVRTPKWKRNEFFTFGEAAKNYILVLWCGRWDLISLQPSPHYFAFFVCDSLRDSRVYMTRLANNTRRWWAHHDHEKGGEREEHGGGNQIIRKNGQITFDWTSRIIIIIHQYLHSTSSKFMV